MAPGIKEFFNLKEFKIAASSSIVDKQRHLLCWGHKVNNVWKDVSKEVKAKPGCERSVTPLFVIVDSVRKLIFYYAQSTLRRAALMAHCDRLNIPQLAIIYPVPTRWFSELYMISRAYHLGPALIAVTTAEMKLTKAQGIVYRKVLDNFSAVLHLLPHIISIGTIWEHWQTILSASNKVTLSLYPEAVRKIMESVSAEKEAAMRESSIRDRDRVADIIAAMRTSIIQRFGEVPLIALAAELLNPATTHRAKDWSRDLRSQVMELLLEWMNDLAPALEDSTDSMWGSAMSTEVLESSRKLSNMGELIRVGKQMDDFSSILRNSPERMKVTRKLHHPCFALYFTHGKCRHRLIRGESSGSRIW